MPADRRVQLVPPRLAAAPAALWTLLTPLIPTFVWVGTPGTAAPRGARARVSPKPVDGIPG